jgi:type I restriction enzyme M protein
MTYWMETMQDDCYLLVSDGWKVGNEVEWTKKEFEGRLIPKGLLMHRYFETEQKNLEQLEANRDALAAQLEELEEEHSGEEGYFGCLDKVNKAHVNAELKTVTADLKADKTNAELLEKKKVLEQYLKLSEEQAEANRKVKETKAELDKKLQEKYPSLTEAEIKTLVVEDKWIATIENTVKNEMQRISQRLTQRIKELAERYETTLSELLQELNHWEEKVKKHLEKMGY